MGKPQSLQFIVSRPLGQETNLLACIKKLLQRSYKQTSKHYPKKLSNSVSHLPLLSIQPIQTTETLFDLSKNDHVIFISTNAVTYAKLFLSDEDWKILLKMPVYAIGQATANLLNTERKQLGINELVIYPSVANTEGLIDAINPQTINHNNWLLVKGLGGREKLKLELTRLGGQVNELEVYKRILPDALTQKKIKGLNNSDSIWIITSSHALKNLSSVLNQAHDQCRLITSSDRITNIAKEMGYQVISQSENATDAALIISVEKLLKEQ